MSAAWIMATGLNGMTKAKLEHLLDTMPDEFRGDRNVVQPTKADLVAFIEEQRRRYWDRGPASPRLQAASRPTITAREVDEWLATLPPVEPQL